VEETQIDCTYKKSPQGLFLLRYKNCIDVVLLGIETSEYIFETVRPRFKNMSVGTAST